MSIYEHTVARELGLRRRQRKSRLPVRCFLPCRNLQLIESLGGTSITQKLEERVEEHGGAYVNCQPCPSQTQNIVPKAQSFRTCHLSKCHSETRYFYVFLRAFNVQAL